MRLLRLSFILALVYFLLLPAFWPFAPPRMKLELPPVVSVTKDAPLSLQVNAWHGNVRIGVISFHNDRRAYLANGSAFPNLTLYRSNEPSRTWQAWTLNRFTFPRRERLELTLPLESAPGELLAGEPYLTGVITVFYQEPNPLNVFAGRVGYRSKQVRLPVRLPLTP